MKKLKNGREEKDRSIEFHLAFSFWLSKSK